MTTPSRFMRSHAAGVLKANPPKAARSTKLQSSRAASRIKAFPLGRPVEIRYIHDRDRRGVVRVHKFPPGSRLLFTEDRQCLLIVGVKVKEFID